MARTKTVDAVLADCDQIIRVWTDNDKFTMADVTLKNFKDLVADLRSSRDETEATKTQLTGLVNATNQKADAASGVVVRARSGFGSFFGRDSTQYEQAGGKRLSDRKRPVRKPKG